MFHAEEESKRQREEHLAIKAARKAREEADAAEAAVAAERGRLEVERAAALVAARAADVARLQALLEAADKERFDAEVSRWA